MLPTMLHRAVRNWGAAALIAVVALAAGIGQTSPGQEILRKTGLSSEPTTYTSLAFLNPQSLPPQLGSQPTNVEVSFMIHNGEGLARDYQWSVRLVQRRGTRSVAAGSIRVTSGGGASITRPARVICTQGQVRIVVSLVYPAESIDFWTTCRSSRS
jgi:hypothetical protein